MIALIYSLVMVNRLWNGYETVGNIRKISLIPLNNLRSQIKSITSETKLHVYCKYGFGLHTRGRELYFYLEVIQTIFLFYQTKIMIQKKNNYLLFNEVIIFIFKFGKHSTNQALNIIKTFTVIPGNFERFQVCFLQ